MRTLKQNFSFTLILGLFFTLAASADEGKLGYVNVRRVISESNEGKKTLADLQKEKAIKQGLLDDKTKVVNDLGKALETQGAVMSAKAKEEKIKKLQEATRDAQELYMGMQTELQKREQEMMEGILGKINPIIAAIAKDDHYTMIFSEGVIFAQPSLDLTNEVIRRYDKANPAKKAATPVKK